MHEAQLHEHSCFLTLTYDEAHLPAGLSLDHRHFQLFMKRFREHALPAKIRFYMCGEYGDINGRPHYHALVFGHFPVDRVFFRTSGAGSKCYTSKSLDALWGYGSVFVGDVTFESAAYVARYVVKKVGSDGLMREIFNVETGEIFRRSHEYGRMSLKPGIGANWFTKFASDVFPHDRVVARGVKCAVPKYYDKLLAVSSPLYLAAIKAARVDKADIAYSRLLDDAPAGMRFTDLQRLAVHEQVKLASIRSLTRS